MAPLAMRPAVGTPCVRISLWPIWAVPVTDTGPCATAWVWPSPPISGVMISVPPISDVASPSADTVTSSGEPRDTSGGRLAVTITPATLRARSGTLRTLTPILSSIDCIACSVNGALRIESPVESSPTTRP